MDDFDLTDFVPLSPSVGDRSSDIANGFATSNQVYLEPGEYLIAPPVGEFMLVPPGMVLLFAAGARLQLSAGYPGTVIGIHGSISAGRQQIFEMLATTSTLLVPSQIRFRTNSQLEIYPEWWGAQNGTSTDDQSALQAAIDAAISRWSDEGVALPVLPILLSGPYSLGSSLVVDQSDLGTGQSVGFILRGTGEGISMLTPPTASSGPSAERQSVGAALIAVATIAGPLLLLKGPGGFLIENVAFDCVGNAAACVWVQHMDEASSDSNRAQANSFSRCSFMDNHDTNGFVSDLIGPRVLLDIYTQDFASLASDVLGTSSIGTGMSTADVGTPIGNPPLVGPYVGSITSLLVFQQCLFLPNGSIAVALEGPISLQVEFDGSVFTGAAPCMIYAYGMRFGVRSCDFYNTAPYSTLGTGVADYGGIDILLDSILLGGTAVVGTMSGRVPKIPWRVQPGFVTYGSILNSQTAWPRIPVGTGANGQNGPSAPVSMRNVGSHGTESGGSGTTGTSISPGPACAMASCVATDCRSNSPQFLACASGVAAFGNMATGNVVLTSIRHDPIDTSGTVSSVSWRLGVAPGGEGRDRLRSNYAARSIGVT